MILDTNAVSAIFSGEPAIRDVLSAEARHHLPVPVLGEYRYGLKRSRQRKRLALLVDPLVLESIVLPLDEQTSTVYADVREQLRRDGRPIPENDVWIAALARQHELPVVSRDRHFDAVRGIERRSW